QVEERINNNEVLVYPTPARDVVNIVLPDAFAKTACVITLLTADGKTVEIKRTQASSLIQLPVNKLTPGMYLLRIASGLKTIHKVITISR
ncbi:MAG: T9SS type A sorting domain-containing protein, partial [Chitinophagaceae bacterium]